MTNLNYMQIRSKLKAIDLFAQPITLTYQGKDNFATSYGGFISLIMIVIFTIIGVCQYSSLLNSYRGPS